MVHTGEDEYEVLWFRETEEWVNGISEQSVRRSIYRLLTEVLPKPKLWLRPDHPKEVRHIEDNIWELKVSRYRLLFCLNDEKREIVVVLGYKKEGQKIPRHVLDKARKRCREVS